MEKQSPKVKSKVAAIIEEAKRVKEESVKGAKVIADREQALALSVEKARKEVAVQAAKRKSSKKAAKKKTVKKVTKKTVKKAAKKTVKKKATKKKSAKK